MMNSRTLKEWEPMKSLNKQKKTALNKLQTKSKAKTKRVSAKSETIVVAPVSFAQKQMGFHKAKREKSKRIVNSELIASIGGSVAFATNRLAVNPGLESSFPWLSKTAKNWEQYRFHRLTFRYVTRSPTSSGGSVILGPDYDVTDPAPSSEVEASNTDDAVEDVVWKEIACSLDPNAMFAVGPRKMVRNQLKLHLPVFDAANFNVSTVGMADTSAVGKLWVDYDVEFFVPQTDRLLANGPEATSVYLHSAAQTFLNTVANEMDWDAATFDPLGIGTPASSSVFTPPAGVYRIIVMAAFADSANEAFQGTVTLLKNGVAIGALGRFIVEGGPAICPCWIQHVIAFNGTDTFSVSVTLSGGAGTLTSNANTTSIIFSIA